MMSRHEDLYMTKSTLVVGFMLALSFASVCCSVTPQDTAGTVAAASPAVPENRTSESAAQQSVRSVVLENERKIWEGFKARDPNAISALLADDVQVVTVNGRFNKSQFLRIVPQLPQIPSYTITNASVISPNKDVAILTYDCKYVTNEPRPMNHSAFQTTVWVNRGGNWVAVFNQETPQ
jgi:hypothetical protein